MWPFSRKEKAPATDAQAGSPENPSTSLANPADWLMTVLGGGPTLAGPVVNEQSAMRSTTVFRCVSLISGLIASLPLMVYEKDKEGRKIADRNRVYPLLHDNPSDVMSGFNWRELIVVDVLLGGNHYSVIEYDGAARVTGFFPVPRNAVTVRKTDAGRLVYEIQLADGSETIDQDNMLHIAGLGFDGTVGLSMISSARQAVGLSLAMEESSSRMHSNGIRPSGVVQAEDGFGSDPVVALRRLRAQFEQAYSGLSNTGKTIYLDKGMKWTPMQITPADAETMEQRRFQVADICRIFGVPPHMVGETDKATSWGSGIEQMMLGFLMTTLQPLLARIENEFNRKLFKKDRSFYAEFNRDALLAMDATARGSFYATMIQNGGLTPNELRKFQNLPAMEGGDQLFINSACVPLTMAGQQPKAPGADPATASEKKP
jgi:HK97 family phage portal protein